MKKIVSLLLVLMLAVGMVGCGNSSDSSDTSATSAAQESDKKDAVVVDTTILKEADDDMLNTYTVIAVNPDAPFVDANGNAVSDVAINTAGADALVQWLLTDEALDLAANYGYDDYGEYLFYREDNAPVYSGDIAKATDDTKTIRLSTTTSVNDSGLLDYLLPIFED